MCPRQSHQQGPEDGGWGPRGPPQTPDSAIKQGGGRAPGPEGLQKARCLLLLRRRIPGGPRGPEEERRTNPAEEASVGPALRSQPRGWAPELGLSPRGDLWTT